jgi:hypothetical protein
MIKTRALSIATAIMAVLLTGMFFAASMTVVVPGASAQALTGDDMWGENTGEEFRETAGWAEGDLATTIATIIRAAMGFLGVVAVVIILAGGFKWMTAGGNDTKVAEAKKLITAGIIGLFIILAAYAIASFVINTLVSATEA